ncbi:MAG TPA: DUF2807 domain-containing protein [Chitinophagaceae bacterium]|nr:DUF2807 domain-containing protein [Chitinophagaceae bacterium]
MKKTGFMLLGTMVLLLSACEKNSLRGSGDTISETRTTATFKAVETHYNIKAVISYGATREVRVTGYENLLPVVKTEVTDGVLKLTFDEKYSTIKNGNVVAQITVPEIEKATVHGSGDIEIYNFNNGSRIDAHIRSSGNIKIANSRYQSAGLHINSSGNISSQTLQAKQAEAFINGSGNIFVSVEDLLKATINGSGNINYWGQPVVETEIHGTGRVIRK